MRLPIWVWLVPAVLCIVALAPMPYGFYTLLRVAVCGAAAALAWGRLSTSSSNLWGAPLLQ